jgi:hypothetical protein
MHVETVTETRRVKFSGGRLEGVICSHAALDSIPGGRLLMMGHHAFSETLICRLEGSFVEGPEPHRCTVPSVPASVDGDSMPRLFKVVGSFTDLQRHVLGTERS